MKKFLLLTLFSLMPYFLLSQNYDWKLLYSALYKQDVVDFKLDFSSTNKIAHINAKDFIKYTPDWEQAVQLLTRKFLAEFNSNVYKRKRYFNAGNYPDAEMVMIIKILNVDGGKIDAIFKLEMRNGAEVFTRYVKSNDGRFGDPINLMGDSLEEMGEYLGKKVKKYLKVYRD